MNNISTIPGLFIHLDRILSAQEHLAPLLDRIDTEKRVLDPNAQKTMLYRYIEDRMYRYAGRLAKEHKIKKEEEIRAMFYRVVDDIFALSSELLQKDGDITPEEISTLHEKLYPKGLWGATIDPKGARTFVLYPAGEYRKQEDYLSLPDGKFWFLASEHIPSAIDRVHDFLANHPEIHPVLRYLLFVAWAGGYVHPYYNGNGTIYRFSLAILLLQHSYPIPDGLDVLLSDEVFLSTLKSHVLT